MGKSTIFIERGLRPIGKWMLQGVCMKQLIVKKNGELQPYDKKKLLEKINGHVDKHKAIKIVEDIEKEISSRFEQFYPNTDNLRDILEKHLRLNERDSSKK